MGLLYNALYNYFIKDDFPLPDGPNKMTLNLLILEEPLWEEKNIDFIVSKL